MAWRQASAAVVRLAGPNGHDTGVTTLMKIYFFLADGLCKLIFILFAKPFV